MKRWPIFLLISIFLLEDISLFAQEKYALPECADKISCIRTFGDRLKFAVPKGVKTKDGRDVDYAFYGIGFSTKSGMVWLSGIFGPSATSGQVPLIMTEQTVVSRRPWVFKDVEGIDMSGRTASGNYWRYVGTQGESIKYFDVSKDAAEYFDRMLDSLCYNPSGGIGLTED